MQEGIGTGTGEALGRGDMVSEEKEQAVQADAREGGGADTAPIAAVGTRETARKGIRPLDVALAVVAVIAVIAAIVGFSLYAGARVPAGSAAKVDNMYITEQSVEDWIAQYRIAYSLEDDDDFGTALLSQGLNVGTFRQNAINQLALSALIDARAKQLGLTPGDEEVQAQIDAAIDTYAFGDDGIWAETLDSYGMTEEGLRSQYRTNLAEQAIYEAEVARRDATDDEIASYMDTYLAGTTQKHACRIVFDGVDASDRAYACYDELKALAEAGGLDADSFAEVARSWSDEDVSETGGSYAWSGSDAMNSEVQDLLADLEVGEFSAPQTISSDDGLVELIFCDEEYAFPSADEGIDADDIPEELYAAIVDATCDLVWEDDCAAYLAQLLGDAQITYYPLPEDAVYNVSLY